MSEANQNRDGLPEHSVVMRLTDGTVPETPRRYADHDQLAFKIASHLYSKRMLPKGANLLLYDEEISNAIKQHWSSMDNDTESA